MHRILGVLALAVALVVASPGLAGASDDPFFGDQWALDAIGAETAWSRGRGGGTVIAVVDTGVDLAHEDLQTKLLAGRSFLDGAASPQDGNGHGTHVAGIAAAATGNGLGIAGVAPDAQILPVQVLNQRGIGNVNAVAEGIRFAADSGADVINLSFGEVSTSVTLAAPFTEAIKYAWAKGSIPVVAAGNDFVHSSSFTDEPALVVTATSRGDNRPAYASGVGNARWGMAAPGGDGSPGPNPTCEMQTGIVSTFPVAKGAYACLVGTSMAAPQVAGAAAVLRGLGLSPQQVVDQLLATADDIGAPGADATFGAGRLNLARAVQAAPPPPPPPTTTTEPPAVIAAVPPTTTTEAPPPSTTEAPPPPTEPPTTTISEPTISPPPPDTATGEAVVVIPDGPDQATRYLLAAPAAVLAVGTGLASWRMRRLLPSPLRPGG